MPLRSGLRLSCFWLVLALVLPWAAMADSCPDCLWSPSSACCWQSGCLCCAPGGSVLTAVVRMDLGAAGSGAVPEPPADRFLSLPPHDVFHVPKTPLA